MDNKELLLEKILGLIKKHNISEESGYGYCGLARAKIYDLKSCQLKSTFLGETGCFYIIVDGQEIGSIGGSNGAGKIANAIWENKQAKENSALNKFLSEKE